jgi:DcuC family C4-dicarboxylate transporter
MEESSDAPPTRYNAAHLMPVIPAALVVVIVGGIFLFRRADVRLVLMLAASALFLVRATQPEVAGARWPAFAQFFAELARQMVSPNSVVPICSAMGFAYVCKLTGCDAHLVHLLCTPLRYVRWLLIPGGIAIAFFVNSAIVSQTSTVSVVGPVLIPLLVGAGISRQTAGALLLLGGSKGGELLNPAAVEVTTIGTVTGADGRAIIAHLLPYNLLASGTALLVFWLMALRYERRQTSAAASVEDAPLEVTPGSIAAAIANNSSGEEIKRINPLKAIVPLIPIILLIFVKRWISLPQVVLPKSNNDITEQTTIAAAMLIGLVCAALTTPKHISNVAAAFFEGAGFAYAHVVSVIIAATMFAEAISVNGIVKMMTPAVKDAPSLLMAASVIVPWAMATITGTAVGTAPLVLRIILPIAMGQVSGDAARATGVHVGGVNAIAAQFGRTSSPVAPVVIMCATLAHSRPLTLVKRIVIPLMAGGVVLFFAAIIRSGH